MLTVHVPVVQSEVVTASLAAAVEYVILALVPTMVKSVQLSVAAQGLHSSLRTGTMRVQRVEKDTPYRTRKILDKMPEGEAAKGLSFSACYLYPLAAASLREVVGPKKRTCTSLAPTHFFERTCTCVGSNEVHVRFSAPTIPLNEAAASGYK